MDPRFIFTFSRTNVSVCIFSLHKQARFFINPPPQGKRMRMKTVLTTPILFAALLLCSTANAQWQEINPTITPSFFNSSVAYEGKIYFTGGPQTASVFSAVYNKNVEVLDLATNTITQAGPGLSVGRCYIACAAYNGKIYFAGGFRFANNAAGGIAYDVVDIYDVATGTFSQKHLSIARGDMGVAVVGGKILFAGGVLPFNNTLQTTSLVDIYDPATDQWSTAHLSQARGVPLAGVLGDKAFFCGGYTNFFTGASSSRVDIYDAATNTWSTAELSLARQTGAVVTVGSYLLVAGGYDNLNPTIGKLNRVDLYNAETGTWSIDSLSAPRNGIAAAAVGNKAYFTGGGNYNISTGYLNESTNIVDVFNASTASWDAPQTLTKNRTCHAAAAWGDKIAVGGGWRAEQVQTTGSVEVFDATTGAYERPLAQPGLEVTPNPVSDQLFVAIRQQMPKPGPIHLQLFDGAGQLVLIQDIEQPEIGQRVAVRLPDLPNGIYWLETKIDGQRALAKQIMVQH